MLIGPRCHTGLRNHIYLKYLPRNNVSILITCEMNSARNPSVCQTVISVNEDNVLARRILQTFIPRGPLTRIRLVYHLNAIASFSQVIHYGCVVRSTAIVDNDDL